MRKLWDALTDKHCKGNCERVLRFVYHTLRRGYFPVIDAVIRARGIDSFGILSKTLGAAPLVDGRLESLREVGAEGGYLPFEGDARGKTSEEKAALEAKLREAYPRVHESGEPYVFYRVRSRVELESWDPKLLEEGIIPFTESLIRFSVIGGFSIRQIEMVPAQRSSVFEPLIRAQIYEQRGRDPCQMQPGIEILPILGPKYPMCHIFASLISSKEGGGVAFVFDNTREIRRRTRVNGGIQDVCGIVKPEDVYPASRHLVEKYRQLTDFLKQRHGVDPQRIARVGWSLGGLIGTPLTSLDPVQVDSLSLAGAHLEEMMLDTEEKALKERIAGIPHIEEFAEWLSDSDNFPLRDALELGDTSKIMLIHSQEEDVVKKKYQEKHRELLGNPETWELPAKTHRSALKPGLVGGWGDVVHAINFMGIRNRFGMDEEVSQFSPALAT